MASLLSDYIPLIPETEKYNLIKSALLGQRGHCYYRLGEYDKSIQDTQEAVFLAEPTLKIVMKREVNEVWIFLYIIT